MNWNVYGNRKYPVYLISVWNSEPFIFKLWVSKCHEALTKWIFALLSEVLFKIKFRFQEKGNNERKSDRVVRTVCGWKREDYPLVMRKQSISKFLLFWALLCPSCWFLSKQISAFFFLLWEGFCIVNFLSCLRHLYFMLFTFHIWLF